MLAAVNNMLVRVDMILNASVTAMLFIGAYGVLAKKEWGPSVGWVLPLITLLFSAYETAMFYYVYPEILKIAAQELLSTTLRYLLPLDIICVVTFVLARRLQKNVKG